LIAHYRVEKLVDELIEKIGVQIEHLKKLEGKINMTQHVFFCTNICKFETSSPKFSSKRLPRL